METTPIKNPSTAVPAPVVMRMARRLTHMTGADILPILKRDVRGLGAVRLHLDGSNVSLVDSVSGQTARELWRAAFGAARKNRPVFIDLTDTEDTEGQ